MSDDRINLLSSDEDQLAWCARRGIQPHQFVGEMDDDCTECGLSIYMACHTDAMPRLDSWE